MAYPNNLDDVAVFKIHPALGVARLSNNDDYYEFFDYEEQRIAGQADSLTYMSVQNGNHWVKRQAVRFKIYAYAEDGQELGELTASIAASLNLESRWNVNIANRKLNNFSGGTTSVVEAQGSAGTGESTRLEGNNPWRDSKVWLGDIEGDGLFIPPKGGVYRKAPTNTIPPYSDAQGANYNKDNDVMDTTSDGSIAVIIQGAEHIDVIPAGILVAPQQHSPDINPEDYSKANVSSKNKDFIKTTRQLLGIAEDASLTGTGYAMDIAMMRTINGDYHPGMEICLQSNTLPEPDKAFYTPGQNHINSDEIRPNYEAGHAELGALTGGLCSVWQTDLNECLNWWTAEFPKELRYEDNPKRRELSRKDYTQTGPIMDNNEDLNAYIDMMGVGRKTGANLNKLRATERDQNDIPGPIPTAPFPLDPKA
ncbi:LodA/GoxA family CTQ-dependent oxidase [Hellea sp.]|nr:LodA/GoxA family CTQ-dependent oxidase [Hellea sp.]